MALLVVVVVVAVLALQRRTEPGPRVLIETVERGRFVREVSGNGVVVPRSERSLGFASGGTVASILVKEGDRVEQGQTLAALDTAATERDLASNEASLASARAELARLTAQQGVDRLDVVAAVATAEDQQARSQQVLDDARAKLEVALSLEQAGAASRDDVTAARDAVDSATRQQRQATQGLETARLRREGADQLAAAQRAGAEANIAQLRTNSANLGQRINDARLIAPFAGLVSVIPFKVGDVVGSGATFAIGIVDDSSVSVTARFDENRAVELRPQQPAEITPDAAPDVRLPALVRRVSHVAERAAGGGAAQVVVDLDFAAGEGDVPAGAVRPGYTVTAKVVVSDLDGVLLIPLEAIVTEAGSSFVYAISSDEDGAGVAQRVPITVEDRNATLAAADSPSLEAGDRIVVTNLENVTDGAAVTFSSTNAP